MVITNCYLVINMRPVEITRNNFYFGIFSQRFKNPLVISLGIFGVPTIHTQMRAHT